ncbi:PAS domain-containing protein [Nocardioides eburneiflavus]|uniref:PAS domain-containing protein n=1 Tax=Nocardioides eburneiflavus TaxID=2518372 RepID=A0A4Z1CHR9_9ACTN|nr:histidine kinase N-terminal 7TM domain-containing protein [Nocardioides eburneiflavus]TGN65728.1 PAS domain-containing protein [Nocardioides eburneiflavus]
MLTLFAVLMVVAGVVLAGLAAYVAWRRESRMGWSLAVLLVAVAWWGLAYAVELSVDDVAVKSRWGDLKYVGILALAPAWLVFVLQYTGRGSRVTRRLLAVLAVEPILALTLLAVPATHDLVRFYPPSAATEDLPIVQVGPAFWAILVYNNLLLVGATTMFVISMVRLARHYRRLAGVLLAVALLPWAANLLHNFAVGWFARIDLTPFAFTVTGGVLVWGLFHERLVDLAPLARSAVLDSMADGVFVLEPFGRIVDVNPAGAALTRASRAGLLGRRLEDVFPGTDVTGDGRAELTLNDTPHDRRTFDVSHRHLSDATGRPAGDLVVLHEITQRVRDRDRLQRVLAEKSRTAAALSASMIPPVLPAVAGIELASTYEPAGDGSEVGGDFLDVFGLDPQTWAFMLGDVSGKGAEAAAVSAAARYTLRALADPDRGPAEIVADVNAKLLAQTDVERHCTLIFGYLRPDDRGTSVSLTLAGHHPPLVLRATGEVDEVGRLGTALALFDDCELYDTTLELAPGEVLCAFTDGLIEARRKSNMFGSRRVAELLRRHGDLPVDELAALICEAVRTFHGDQLQDDVALLLIRASTTPDPEAVRPDDRPGSRPAG